MNNKSFCVSSRKNDPGRFEIVNNRNYGQATSNPQDVSRKRLSSSLQDDSGTCKNDAPRSRALDKIAPAEEFAIVPYDPHPTPNPQEAIAEVANSLANMTTRCEDLLRSAKTLGSVPIQQAARRELRRLQKKARGPWRGRATVTVTMAHLEDRTAFDGHLERTRARKLKDEEQRLKQMSEKLKKREAKLGRARAKVKAAMSESGSDGSHD